MVLHHVCLFRLDSHCARGVQGLAIMLCALGPEEINEIRVGPLTPYAVWTLRHIKEALGVTFSIKPEGNSETIFLSCVGCGISNMAKKST